MMGEGRIVVCDVVAFSLFVLLAFPSPKHRLICTYDTPDALLWDRGPSLVGTCEGLRPSAMASSASTPLLERSAETTPTLVQVCAPDSTSIRHPLRVLLPLSHCLLGRPFLKRRKSRDIGLGGPGHGCPLTASRPQ
ncbi:hypothetical protein BKA56DRAFT_4913 [Ilyonectria sp. MPI-CAGE-AT-0026]|nr:hypothetical protein BKA56DRAFT_4913 [Ilyonectria sp. MPI-CAGE-AT-0026]